ncbi:MAG: guanylate kinase, partial [Dehalococcoidia bacterium]
MKQRPVVVVLHGPSGVGKDAVVDRLSAEFGLHRPTSTTSRPPRVREVDGVHYHFISREEFERKIRAGDFLEYAPVYDDWKGLEREEFTRALAGAKDIVIRTDVQGARTWRRRRQAAVFVFLAAEDRDVLRARLLARDT